MQCPSCHFENMPQYKTCVRCGSILPGTESSIPFEPPRAGRFEKALHLAGIMRLFNRIAGRIADGLSFLYRHSSTAFQTTWRHVSFDLSLMGMFWKGILPGLPQWYVGRNRAAQAFFFTWLGLLLGGVLTFGLAISPILIGLAFSAHLSSIVDIALRTSFDRSDRVAMVSVMSITAILLFYTPTWAVFWRHLAFQRITVAIGPLQSGDSLLYTRTGDRARPRPGDLVLYRSPEVRYSADRGNVEYRLQGNMFDRVLALETQQVRWENGRLYVDGKTSPYKPLAAVGLPPDAEFVVPEGHYYIVPTPAFQTMALPIRESDWRSVGIVPRKSIYGIGWGIRRSLFHFVPITPEPES